MKTRRRLFFYTFGFLKSMIEYFITNDMKYDEYILMG